MLALSRVSMLSLALVAHGGFPLGKLAPVMDYVQRHAGNVSTSKMVEAVQGLNKQNATPVDSVRTPVTASHELSPKAAAPVASNDKLGSLMNQQEAALRSSAKALNRYQDASAETQRLIREKDALKKLQQDAAKVVKDAAAKVQDAKGARLSAARLDMRTNPTDDDHDKSVKSLAAAEAQVADAQKAWLAATKAAESEDGKAEKATDKVKQALEKQAEAEEEVRQTRDEAQKLAGALAREDKKLQKSVASLRKEEDAVTAALQEHWSKNAS